MKDKQTTVLLIDNDEDLLTAISTRLRFVGYRCLTARTGAQGMNELVNADVDLIVTDMNMPALDGAGVIEKVRSRCETPIIVMTGFRRAYHKQLAGVRNVQVIEKPFMAHDLIDAIESELYMNQHRDAA